MKQLIMLMLSLTMLVSACSNGASSDKKDEAPKVEVKINKAEEAKKKIKEAKERGKKATTEEVTTEAAIDTDKYNAARECLLNGVSTDCSDLENSEEYSKAWNNLTSEGYLCQDGRCYSPEQQQTTEAPADTQTEAPSTEEQSTEVPATDAPADVQTEVPAVQ